MKNIIIAILALILLACDSQEKEPNTQNDTDQEAENFKDEGNAISSQSLFNSNNDYLRSVIEIDQESIEIDLLKNMLKLRARKIKDIDIEKCPKVDYIEISDLGSENSGRRLQVNSDYTRPSESIVKLNYLLRQAVGTTVELRFEIEDENLAKKYKTNAFKRFEITKLTTLNRAEFEAALDFVMQLKKVVLSGDNNKLKSLVDYNDELGLYYSEKEEFNLPIDEAFFREVNRDKMRYGYQTLYRNDSDNEIVFLRLYYDEERETFVFLAADSYIYTDEYTLGASGGFIYFTKVNGKFKIVNTIAAG